MRVTNPALSVIFIAVLGTISSANAADCNQLTPTLGNGSSDQYFELEFEPIQSGQKHKLTSFADRLSGKWQGVQSESLCKGHFTKPTSQDFQYRVHAEISENFSGAIRLEAEKESRRKVKLEKVYLSPTTNQSNNLWQTGTITFSGPNSIIFSDIYHTRSARVAFNSERNSVRTVEELKRVTLLDNTLTIDRQTYVNGYLVSQDAWQLERH
ncbi:hypothetical protein AB833_17245 [Chromatiales bacterium (ex Bugula neritina AB1)]|nr:hypothetical protein AB833_17245 [Chromatiales bacterium (ex Bugula neritina AB1)]